MSRRKDNHVRQYGDFQTPLELAAQVCTRLRLMGVKPSAILEPTCGRGAFLRAAVEAFPEVKTIIGVDINAQYVAEARGVCGGRAQVEQGDFFRTDWPRILGRGVGNWLVLGNPPWVTNAELGLLNSTNLPAKSNVQGHRGLDALTGKANFDISEWMVQQQVGWLKERHGWIAMLMKTAVARRSCGRRGSRASLWAGLPSSLWMPCTTLGPLSMLACWFSLSSWASPHGVVTCSTAWRTWSPRGQWATATAC